MAAPDAQSAEVRAAAYLERLKRSAAAIEKLKARVDAANRREREPIAVVGMGLRMPGGVRDAEGFWELLSSGRDAVGEIGELRPEIAAAFDPKGERPGTHYCTRMGALDSVDRFDEAFFGIAPREARAMDPQQRLLLEVSWEALEDAGIAPDSLDGTRAGVFVGICGNDWAERSLLGGDLLRIDTYSATGNGFAVPAGRIAYTLGVQGPAISLDTACSSSLVAVHLAADSLRRGECDVALAGGVNLLLSPAGFVAMSRLRALSPSGRCASFDAAADGYVRGEGCGVLALRRLTDAERDGDRVLALVLGSAVNQDGRSSGLTAPNGPAQQKVIAQALAQARVEPAQVAFVETHGTGTPLGDPIEGRALAQALGEGRERPLWLGALKSQLGHLEGAAGVAGLCKAILALQHRTLPPNLHLETPNPHLPWDTLPLALPRSLTPLESDGPLVAGVSSFGISGTNAHVVLGEAPKPPAPPLAQPAPHLLLLSARSDAALDRLATRYQERLRAPGTELAAIAGAAHATRNHFEARLALVADSASDAAERLSRSGPDIVRGRLPRGTPAPKVAFLFTGQGAQYPGMGLGLLTRCEAFAETLRRCDDVLAQRLGAPLAELLADPDPERLAQTGLTQPVTTALQLALVAQWRAFGVTPAVCLGHSVGEIAAASTCGVFSLQSALELSAQRGALMQALPAGGAMLSVAASAEIIEPYLAELDGLEIAAFNGPEQTVLSGDATAVDGMHDMLVDAGLRARRLEVSHAFHSRHTDPMLGALGEVFERLGAQTPSGTLISNLSGGPAGDEIATADYWQRHARSPVRFSEGLRALAKAGATLLVEIGPGSTLLGLAGRHPATRALTRVPSLRRGTRGAHALLEATGRLHLAGARLDLPAVQPPPAARPRLPTYPFERNRHWLETADTYAGPFRAEASPDPLLGHRLRSAGREVLHHLALSLEAQPWLGDHRARGRILVPAAAWLAIALRRSGERQVEALEIRAPLWLDDGEAAQLQIVDGQALQIVRDHGERFEDLARARFGRRTPTASLDLAAVQARLGEAQSADVMYRRFEERGLSYGPAFRGLRRVWSAGDEVLAELHPGAPTDPGRLDAAFQALAAVGEDDPRLFLPVEIAAASATPDAREGALWVHGRLERRGVARIATLRICDAGGEVRVRIDGLRLQPAGEASAALQRHLYEVAWIAAPAPAGAHDTDAETQEIFEARIDADTPADQTIETWLAARAQRRQLPASTRLIIQTPSGAAPQQALFGPLAECATSEGLGPTVHLCAEAGVDAAGSPDRQQRSAGDHIEVPRLRPAPPLPAPLVRPQGDGWRLDVTTRGSLDALCFDSFEETPLGDDEVELDVLAAGLNFRDVLGALGQYPVALPLGCECVGRVRRTGTAAGSLAPGTRVMGLVSGCFGPVARAPAAQLVPVPEGMRAVDAATLPVVFTTAWHALVELGELQAGQRVLIHAAAGGVGLAAVQIAQHLGAEIYATASPSKWPALRALGVRHLATSRRPGFADAWDHPKLDVVLNSLTGEMIPESLGLLREGGRFLEMGKAEIWEDTRVRDLAPGVHYRAFDIAELRPDAIQALLQEIRQAVEADALTALPKRSFPLADAPAAFRHMARARHIGKIVLDVAPEADHERAVLITGGLGALGLQVAHWLATERGVRRLLLASRSGASAAQAAAIERLRALGADVQVLTVDVADPSALAAALDAAPTLCGVVHAAGVLEDGLLRDQSDDAVRRVLRPKLAGALNLDALTRAHPLDFFVCFSSAAAALAAPGQSAYAAANAALDALCEQRQRLGRPALSLQWSAWAGAGMAENTLTLLERRGLRAIEPRAGLALLGRCLDAASAPVLAIIPADRARLAAARTPLLTELCPAATAAPEAGGLGEAIAGRLRRILGTAPDATLDPDTRFDELGLDSLMGVELHGELQNLVGRELPSDLLIGAPTLRQLEAALGAGDAAPPRAQHVERFLVPRHLDHPRAILFCLPYAGGEATEFSRWREGLPRWCELRAAWLPGRGPRRDEAPAEDLDRLVQDLLPDIEAATRIAPVYLFGHSLGALLAFELTHALVARGAAPARLMLSAPLPLRRPGTPGRDLPLHTLDDDAMVHELSRLGGIPPQLRSRPALLQRFLAAIRADLAAHERFVHPAQLPALTLPVTLLGGRSDPLSAPETLEVWRSETQGHSEVFLFPGGHFFLRAQRESVVGAVAELLSR